MISAGWIDQWTYGDDSADVYLQLELHGLTVLYRPEDCMALQWVLLGFGFWIRWDWE